MNMMNETGQAKNDIPPPPTNGAAPPTPAPAPAGGGGTQVRVNVYYYRTLPGLLKLVELVFGLICIACGAPSHGISAVDWFLFVVVLLFILTFVWIVLYLFNLNQALTLPWPMIEMGYTGFATLLEFLAAVVLLVRITSTNDYWYAMFWGGTSRYNSYVAAGVFALFNMLVFASECFLHYQEWRHGPAS